MLLIISFELYLNISMLFKKSKYNKLEYICKLKNAKYLYILAIIIAVNLVRKN